MKHLIIIFFILYCFIFCGNVYAQSANENIALDVNKGQWFALERHLAEFPADFVSPFMELIGRAFISSKFNLPEESVKAFNELLNNHSESLGLSNILMMSHFMANDLSKLGRNAEAAELINDIVEATTWNAELTGTQSPTPNPISAHFVIQFLTKETGKCVQTYGDTDFQGSFTYNIIKDMILFNGSLTGYWTVIEHTKTQIKLQSFQPNEFILDLTKI